MSGDADGSAVKAVPAKKYRLSGLVPAGGPPGQVLLPSPAGCKILIPYLVGRSQC